MKKLFLIFLTLLVLMSLFVFGVGAEGEPLKPTDLEYGEVLYTNPLTELPAGTAYGTTTTGWSADGECVTLSGEQDNWYVLDGTDQFDDGCIVSIDLNLQSEYGAVGIGIRKWEGDPGQSGYEIDWLTGSGVLSMHRPFGGYDTQNAEFQPEIGVLHNLTVVLDGYNVDFYVDGQLVNTLYADLYPSDGSLALYGYHCTATFQNLIVYDLPGEETTETTEPETTEPKATEKDTEKDTETTAPAGNDSESKDTDAAGGTETGVVTDQAPAGGLSVPAIVGIVVAAVLVIAVSVPVVLKAKKT